MSQSTPNKGDYVFHTIAGLQYQVQHLTRENEKLTNGEAFRELEESKEYWRKKYEQEHAARKKEKTLAEARIDREVKCRTKVLQEIAEDAYAELERVQKKYEELLEEVESVKEERDQARGAEKAAVEYTKTLECRLNMNSSNSSIPPSKDPIGKKVAHKRNHRNVSGKKPGAQPGHKHHPRRMLEPTEDEVLLEDRPPGYEEGGAWRKTDETVAKLFVGVKVEVPVTPYVAPIWVNDETEKKWRPSFPFGMEDEINYLPELRAFCFFLTQQMNVAGRKAQTFLEEATGGILRVSNGWIAQLSKEFACKSREEIAAIFMKLRHADVVGVDSTTTRNNGRQECITVCRNEEAAFFAHTEHKGHEAAAALPCAPGSGYDGDVVSDREAAFKKLGNRHQECLVHLSRDLLGVMEREPHVAWAPDMRRLILDMLADRHDWGADGPDPEKVREWHERYDEIVNRGGKEYVKHPPTADYLKGHNLRMHFKDSKEDILYFLENPGVPPENNGSERDLRGHKRSLAMKTTFRSPEYLKAHCDFLTISVTAGRHGDPVLEALNDIFERPKPS